MPYVTGAEILTHVGKGSPSTDDSTWAGLCAAAIEGGIASLLEGTVPDAGGDAELGPAALTDGAALFNSRAAPHGVLSVGPDGDVVRLGADSLRSVRPVIRRIHPTAGIGIG
jgi:hypothetical protein